jgi:hypothetical protein
MFDITKFDKKRVFARSISVLNWFSQYSIAVVVDIYFLISALIFSNT